MSPESLSNEKILAERARLKALFEEMNKQQLTFLDEAGKRIIELGTGLLGILFAVIAFGKDFPPPYLTANPLVQGLAVAVLVVLTAALLAGVVTVQPAQYRYNPDNVTFMKEELERITKHKSGWMRWATWLFFAGTALLALLIIVLVCSA
ncbi:MAG TPA: hypothetical protein PKG95_08115 [Anaerolineaceae bacterium]|jgi:hypothetical protein|nr:hypothetical protein [Anaerolineaceae bacterium]